MRNPTAGQWATLDTMRDAIRKGKAAHYARPPKRRGDRLDAIGKGER